MGVKIVVDRDDRPDRMIKDPDRYFAEARKRAAAELEHEDNRSPWSRGVSDILVVTLTAGWLVSAIVSLLVSGRDDRLPILFSAGAGCVGLISLIFEASSLRSMRGTRRGAIGRRRTR
jgi:hypothetical protein